jgi:transposase-like protein
MVYGHLIVDARYEHVRQGGHVVRQGVLIVAGVRADGHREICAITVADTESEATYHHLFADLKARGLSGVRLMTNDAHKGLKAAIDQHFQGASWQRCQVHFARYLVGMVRADDAASWRRTNGKSSRQRHGNRQSRRQQLVLSSPRTGSAGGAILIWLTFQLCS